MILLVASLLAPALAAADRGGTGAGRGEGPDELAARRVVRDQGLPSLEVEASCESLAGPGKVRCAVHVRPRGGIWRSGDVIVMAAPSFAPPLRTRAGLADLVRKDESEAEFALALAAVTDGSGTLRIKARAVVCGERGCRPVSAEAEARVVVGGSP
jgi:hypothetical protein